MAVDEGATVLPPGRGKTVSFPGTFSGNGLTFVHGGPDGAFSLVEWDAGAGAPGTPLHIHRATDEAFYVVEGTFGFRAGRENLRGSGRDVRLRAQGGAPRVLEPRHHPGQDAHHDLPARLRALL